MEIIFDYYDEVTSTNEVAKQQIDAGVGEGLVVLAWNQTGGRGRLGRTFFSRNGGIYLSMVLPLSSDSLKLTAKAGVALMRAIKAVTDKDVKIKWVNDILYNNKKVAGILAEVYKENVILGVGVNFKIEQSAFPAELKDTAISLYNGNYKCDTDPLDLVNSFIRNMEELVETETDDFIKDYVSNNAVIGKKVQIYKAGVKVGEGEAVSIDDNCYLHVVEKSGNEVTLSSGEVTIKL